MLKVQFSSLVCGVGPAERTGKSVVTYCPGGKRFFGACCCRLDLKPREIRGWSLAVVPFPGGRLGYRYQHDPGGAYTGPCCPTPRQCHMMYSGREVCLATSVSTNAARAAPLPA